MKFLVFNGIVLSWIIVFSSLSYCFNKELFLLIFSFHWASLSSSFYFSLFKLLSQDSFLIWVNSLISSVISTHPFHLNLLKYILFSIVVIIIYFPADSFITDSIFFPNSTIRFIRNRKHHLNYLFVFRINTWPCLSDLFTSEDHALDSMKNLQLHLLIPYNTFSMLCITCLIGDIDRFLVIGVVLLKFHEALSRTIFQKSLEGF